jgi:hypothetical protein
MPNFSLVAKGPHTLHLVTQGTKVSFLGYAYPVLFPAAHFENVSVADPRDIACMKLSVIASRGTKRDFIDFYVVSEQYGLKKSCRRRERPVTSYALTHIVGSGETIFQERSARATLEQRLSGWKAMEEKQRAKCRAHVGVNRFIFVNCIIAHAQSRKYPMLYFAQTHAKDRSFSLIRRLAGRRGVS